MSEDDAQSSAASFQSAIKLLVSNNVAGSIIGRSGQTISDLQSQSGSRIKLSQADDYYPGTQDRVCLVQGSPDNVKRATNLLLSRLYALQQNQHHQNFAWQRQQHERALIGDGLIGISDSSHVNPLPGFAFIVRILIPVPCCGMMIGKGGSNVKHIVESSGVSAVRLAPKEGGDPDTPFTLNPPSPLISAQIAATAERMLSITGPDLSSCLHCLHIILDEMNSHPDISRYTNMTTSYIRAATNTKSDYHSLVTRRADPMLSLASHDDRNPFHRSLSYNFLDRQGVNPSPHFGITQSQPTTSRVDSMLQYVAFTGQTSSYIPQDLAPIPSIQQMQNSLYLYHRSSSNHFPAASSINSTHRMPSSQSAPDLLAVQMQTSLRMSDVLEGQTSMPFEGLLSSFSLQDAPPPHSPPGYVAQMAVPENLVGTILGRGGRSLTELQAMTNTQIRITQRGEYLPGTKNRVVTIRGPTSQGVSSAQYLMSQRMIQPTGASNYPMERDWLSRSGNNNTPDGTSAQKPN
jgi:RNA-binding protein Nova